MAGMLEHIIRASRSSLRAHACRWVGLPEVTVPSAACDDEQVDQWSDERYKKDLADEQKRAGEAS